MNLLINKAPDYIIVGGKKLRIRTDFNLWVAFIVSCEKGDAESILTSITNIVAELPPKHEEFIQVCIDWLFPENAKRKQTGSPKNIMRQTPFDFEMDGSVIYCELWEYFPHLMERGISFHEGMELIKILLNNENTVIWHRAFARCGDFSKMDKEKQQYWQKQRALYAIKSKNITQEDKDRWLYNAF